MTTLKVTGLALSTLFLAAVPVYAQEVKGNTPGIFQGEFAQLYVTFNPEAAQALLPEGLKIAEGATGGINTYMTGMQWPAAAPFTATYWWIDVAGHDSQTGSKGRYVIKYESQDALKASIDLLGWPFGVGGSTVEQTGADTHTVGMAGDAVLSDAVITEDPATCGPAAGDLNYVTVKDGAVQVSGVAFAGTFCPAVVKSGGPSASVADVYSGLDPKVVGAGRLKNGIVAFTARVPVAD